MKKQNFSFRLGLRLLFVLATIMSCKEKNKTEKLNSDSFYTIPFSEIVKNKREVKLSEFATDVGLIQLEDTPEALLGNIENIELTKDYIFFKCWKHPVFQFSHDGKFVRHIGAIGKGPQEYSSCMKLSVDEKNEKIYIHTTELSMLVFNFEGEYLKTIRYPALARFLNFRSRDRFFVSYQEPIEGKEPYVFMEHDEQGDTLQGVANHIFFDPNEAAYNLSDFEDQNFSYRFENKLHLKGCYNDTVYFYDENNKIVPEFFIDLKKHKIPDDLIYERKWTRSIPDDLCWTGVHETARYIFIPYGYHFDPDKPKSKKEEKGCLLYDKKTGEGVAVKETKRGGFADDISGGPDFRPIITNDSTAVMYVSALDMKQYLNSDQFKNQEVKFPKKKEKLNQLRGTLNEDDNHFLVLVKLKK